ncbi:unnamed protein product [Owenia fusiformis]|uniref:Uncharacterized protein n=1 Tax=Owenia fusiformis TaxID=6347 RepID=A0A8J1XRN9_OWEFU|nr:unnamed protein product [Owenia fusiformis]
MKIMAENDYFPIGSLVSCKTCHGQEIQGEVMAFDHGYNLLVLKSAAGSGKANTHDVRFINLQLVEDVKFLNDEQTEAPPLTSLNISKLHSRARQSVEEKQRQVKYIGVGVTAEAQQLFHFITKTINDIRWEGKNIVVFDTVIVTPPYSVNNCTGKDGSDALTHIRKLVEKFHRDVEGSRQSQSPTTS